MSAQPDEFGHAQAVAYSTSISARSRRPRGVETSGAASSASTSSSDRKRGSAANVARRVQIVGRILRDRGRSAAGTGRSRGRRRPAAPSDVGDRPPAIDVAHERLEVRARQRSTPCRPSRRKRGEPRQIAPVGLERVRRPRAARLRDGADSATIGGRRRRRLARRSIVGAIARSRTAAAVAAVCGRVRIASTLRRSRPRDDGAHAVSLEVAGPADRSHQPRRRSASTRCRCSTSSISSAPKTGASSPRCTRSASASRTASRSSSTR